MFCNYIESLNTIEGNANLENITTLVKDGKTTYQGSFMEFDWSATGVRRSLPVTFVMNVTNNGNNFKDFTYEFTINAETVTGTGKFYKSIYPTIDDSFNFNTNKLLFPKLPRLLKDHPDKDKITYSIKELFLKETTINNKPALIGRVSSQGGDILEFKEQIRAPYRMILYPQETTSLLANATSPLTENSERISKNSSPIVLDKDFAVISPNPIGDQFSIIYTLDQTADVQVAIYDFYGRQHIYVPSQKNTTGGTQTITINSATLRSGTYIIQMIINGSPYSKTVIKL
ncbi:T9SS type A sorting domain-containing protein [Aquimarina longa]|uniref:T9SS type A sorting domain-containing protein n=1 Tax=Aquimarina longa TaxID=1080221 RepID=UPI0007836F43|nr:T9SS type A sorting domain-containing protein [Aquimarina longa]